MTTGKAPIVTDAVEVPVPGKSVREFIGRISSGDERVSIAVMGSPPGWTEPAQTPEFDEHTIVLSGTLRVHHPDGVTEVKGGQAITTPAGVKVRYETPDGAEYVAICLPAFAFHLAHRDE
jgi:mannose-6-phosphate isomerase-like protein (cupin superfamily)